MTKFNTNAYNYSILTPLFLGMTCFLKKSKCPALDLTLVFTLAPRIKYEGRKQYLQSIKPKAGLAIYNFSDLLFIYLLILLFGNSVKTKKNIFLTCEIYDT